jgi:predicted nucleic acid-binding protein
MILLDTSILIELFRKKIKSRSKYFQLLETYTDFAISTITYFEIGVGSKESDMYFWNQFLANLEIIPFDQKASIHAIEIFQYLKASNRRIDFADLQIAATATSCNLPLSTLNKKHFEIIPNLEVLP